MLLRISAKQTEIYDAGGDDVVLPLLRDLKKEAQRLANKHRCLVDIVTYDNSPVDVVHYEEPVDE